MITVERIRNALGETVLKGEQRLPSDEALRTLAGHLEHLRVIILERLIESPSPRQRALAYLSALRELLPQILCEGKADMLGTIDRLACALTQGFLEGPTSTEWGDYAEEIAREFRNAMRSSNRDLDLKLSKVGPVARFVYMVIPWLTGEKPKSVEAVAKAMQRRAKRDAGTS